MTMIDPAHTFARIAAVLLLGGLIIAGAPPAGILEARTLPPQPVANDNAPEGEELSPVATVTFSSGRNRVRRAETGRLQRLVTEMELYEGDQITVAHGGRVTLVYAADGDYRSLEPGAELTVEPPEAPETAEEQEADARRVSDAVREALRREGEGSMAAVGGTRLPDDPRKPSPLFPRLTKLMPTDTITFRWKESRLGAEAWRVAVLHEGEELIATETESTEWRVGPETYRFQPGRLYAWYVMPADGSTVPEPKPFFTILEESEAEPIRAQLTENAKLATHADDPAPRFLDARLMLAEGLVAEAQAILEELYALAPGDTGLLERLREAYTAQRYSPRQIKRRIDELRRSHPEFREPGEIELNRRGDTIEVGFRGTDHPDAHTYVVRAVPIQDGEPIRTAEVHHDPGTAEARYEVTVGNVEPSEAYRVEVVVKDESGERLRFDIPVEPQMLE